MIPVKRCPVYVYGRGHYINLVLSIFCMIVFLSGCSLTGFGKKDDAGKIVVQKNPCVVLALPTTGPYAPIAGKIKKGANLAAKELAATGINTHIAEINTQESDWLLKLDKLPEECAIVGGPLQEKAYMEARKSGALQRRAFFAFLPSLQQNDEGKLAWRFFPGPKDQIDALVNFAVDEMNIHNFASFYPDDNYGRRMTALLEEELAKKNAKLQKMAYIASSPASWNSAIQKLVNPEYLGLKKQPVPRSTFEAIFLPDSWKHMENITTGLMGAGEDRLVLLGTTLWEQGLAGKQVPKVNRYALAVFPATWDKAKSPKEMQRNDADFWVALGFDFLNFAVNTGLIHRVDAENMKMRASHAAGFVRAMAPVHYDNNGLLHQKLYLFQAASNGSKPLNMDDFRQTRQRILEQSALRSQNIRENAANEQIMQEKPEIQDDSQNSGEVIDPFTRPVPTETVQPVNMSRHENYAAPAMQPQQSVVPAQGRQVPARQIMSPVPQPSYKLRLPAKAQ